MQTKMFAVGDGAYRLEAVLVATGNGISITVCTAEHGHVGATALAVPRPSLADASLMSATTSVLVAPAHKDDYPARHMAEYVASRMRVNASVSAGLHIDDATMDDIDKLTRNVLKLEKEMGAYFDRLDRARWDDEDSVIAVSPDGAEIGPVDRMGAHTGDGILHQAFCVFLVEGEDIVLCRRSRNKRLWGGVLADTCAGHPKVGESVLDGATRRLTEEVGAATELVELGSIVYREDHGDGRCECELCHVLAGRMPADARLNDEEISELRRASLSELNGYISGYPEQLAPWTRLALEDGDIRAGLENLIDGGGYEG